MRSGVGLRRSIGRINIRLVLLIRSNVHFCSSVLPGLCGFMLGRDRRFSARTLGTRRHALHVEKHPGVMLTHACRRTFNVCRGCGGGVLNIVASMHFPHMRQNRGSKLTNVGLYTTVHGRSPFMPLVVRSDRSSGMTCTTGCSTTFVSGGSGGVSISLHHVMSSGFNFNSFVFHGPSALRRVTHMGGLGRLRGVLFTIPTRSFLCRVDHGRIDH